MQVLERDAGPPKVFRGENPPLLHANIAAFERLLAHDRRARIVLANFGEDPTGQFSLALARRLLAAHPNLYLIVTPLPVRDGESFETSPFNTGGNLRREWLQLVADFPDRFPLGSLSFHAAAPNGQRRAAPDAVGPARKLIAALPADLRHRLTVDTALALYGLR